MTKLIWHPAFPRLPSLLVALEGGDAIAAEMFGRTTFVAERFTAVFGGGTHAERIALALDEVRAAWQLPPPERSKIVDSKRCIFEWLNFDPFGIGPSRVAVEIVDRVNAVDVMACIYCQCDERGPEPDGPGALVLLKTSASIAEYVRSITTRRKRHKT